MWGSYGGWAPYVTVAERRQQAARAVEKLRKKGHPVAPVTITGRAIAATVWGKAWCTNLEGYRDYENRLPRGRTYVRNGSVIDLQIAPREVKAMVSGSSIYTVKVTIAELPGKQWKSICADCAGGIDSIVELLQGRFAKGVMERICRQDEGLFPRPAEIRFACSCPDHASMCKHVAAVLYGVGARLDDKPELLFRLRAVDENELVAGLDAALPLSKTGPAGGKVLETDDISALFGLDMDGAAGGAGDAAPAAPKPRARRKAAAPADAPARRAKAGGKAAAKRPGAQQVVAGKRAAAKPKKAKPAAKAPGHAREGRARPGRRSAAVTSRRS